MVEEDFVVVRRGKRDKSIDCRDDTRSRPLSRRGVADEGRRVAMRKRLLQANAEGAEEEQPWPTTEEVLLHGTICCTACTSVPRGILHESEEPAWRSQIGNFTRPLGLGR